MMASANTPKTPDPSHSERSPRPSITESPWFWAYVFGTAALIALFFAGNKFGPRQAQIEREYQARTRAAQRLNGQEPSGELSTAERTLVTLQPLWYVVAAVTVLGWILFWRSWQRGAAATTQTTSQSLSSSAQHVDPG